MGLMGGIATAAYLDLLIRSCPRGLQGTTLMLSTGLYLSRRVLAMCSEPAFTSVLAALKSAW